MSQVAAAFYFPDGMTRQEQIPEPVIAAAGQRALAFYFPDGMTRQEQIPESVMAAVAPAGDADRRP